MIGLELLSVVLCLGLSMGETDINDFDQTYQGYEFIFHDTKDLGVVIHGNNCYFLYLPDRAEEDMQHSDALQHLESEVISLIEHDYHHEHVLPSTLDLVRDKYQDRLADFHCLNKNVFEIGVSVCLNGWTGFRGSCYKFFQQQVDYGTATHRCRESNSYLVEITSMDENKFVDGLTTFRSSHHSRIWIGLDDKDNEGRFVLPSSGKQPGFEHWDHDEPDDFLHYQDCVVMSHGGLWDDTFCPEQHSYVCEMQ